MFIRLFYSEREGSSSLQSPVAEVGVLFRYLPIQRYFCVVYVYEGKADLSKGCWKTKRKVGVTMHFQR